MAEKGEYSEKRSSSSSLLNDKEAYRNDDNTEVLF